MFANVPKIVRLWLLTGCIMIIVQVALGGITRLTGSGLSITEWAPIMGWIPPMNHEQWMTAFEKYQATPQFHLLNEDMELSGFKFIFFWEYFHRVWARLIGFVFFLPFCYFLYKRYFDKALGRRMIGLFVLGGLQGLVGWLMVSTGLKDRPWVSPFSLSSHLLLALFTYCFLLWTYWQTDSYNQSFTTSGSEKKWLNGVLFLTAIQIMFGGFTAGAHAALNFNTWPDMNGHFIPESLYNEQLSFWKQFLENNTWIQFVHRSTAYVLTVLILLYWWKERNNMHWGRLIHFLPAVILIQVILGITTIMLSVGKIPLLWAELHQLVAVALLTIVLRLRYKA